MTPPPPPPRHPSSSLQSLNSAAAPRPAVQWCALCAMVAQPLSGSRLHHMDYDTRILPRTGGYGRYNRLVVVCSWFPTFAVTLNLISDVFYTRIPDSYHCKPDPQLLPSAFLLSNLSSQRYLNLTIPWVNGTGLSHCELFKYPSNSSDLSENVPKEKVSCTKGWEFAHEAGLQSNFVTEVRAIAQEKEDLMKRLALTNFDISGWIVVQHGGCNRVQSSARCSLSRLESHAVIRTPFHSWRSIFAQAASLSCCGSASADHSHLLSAPASKSSNPASERSLYNSR